MAFVFPDPPKEYDPFWMRELLQRIEHVVAELEASKFVQKGWTISTANLATARTVTASGSVAMQFCTLIDDLIRKGVISGES